MSGPRTHALLALLGATSLGEMGCFGDEDGAQPTSSVGSVGEPDSGVFDPHESGASTSGSTGTGTASGMPGPASGNSATWKLALCGCRRKCVRVPYNLDAPSTFDLRIAKYI